MTTHPCKAPFHHGEIKVSARIDESRLIREELTCRKTHMKISIPVQQCDSKCNDTARKPALVADNEPDNNPKVDNKITHNRK